MTLLVVVVVVGESANVAECEPFERETTVAACKRSSVADVLLEVCEWSDVLVEKSASSFSLSFDSKKKTRLR